MKLHFFLAMSLFSFLIKTELTFSQVMPDKAAKECTIEIFLVNKFSHLDSTIETSNSPGFRCRYCFIPATEDLADTAFINDKEITGYGLVKDGRGEDSSYYLLLNEQALTRLHNLTSKTDEFPVRTAFALVLNGKPVFGGWFLSRFVSNFHGADWVHVFTPFDENKKGGLRFDLHPMRTRSYPFNSDPRRDLSFIECLKRTGRYINK